MKPAALSRLDGHIGAPTEVPDTVKAARIFRRKRIAVDPARVKRHIGDPLM
jgi:hypothetical protein